MLNKLLLLQNRVLTSVIKDFQHRLLTDVKSTDVESIIVNISFEKLMLTNKYNIGYLNS